MKKVVIIGAGPAGLTAAYEMLKNSEYSVTIVEKENQVGGLSKTNSFNGNKIDIGGHRYFTSNERVEKIWNDILPISEGGMLRRNRLSHILYRGKSISYPLEINKELLQCAGISEGMKILMSFLYARHYKIKSEKTLEEFYINRFGKKLYKLFFEDYTKKLWGIPPSQMKPDWGNQRIQNLDLMRTIGNVIASHNQIRNRSLIESFYYPTYGSGQMWNEMCRCCICRGATIRYNSEVVKLEHNANKKFRVWYRNNGNIEGEYADVVISTMPLRDLMERTSNCPSDILNIASRVKYRDMLTVSFFINSEFCGERLKDNSSDCWMYIQERTVKAGRLQILNNWSEYLLAKKKGFLLQVEYYCNEGDILWKMEDVELLKLALNEMKICKIVTNDVNTTDYAVHKIKKAYPIYDEIYDSMEYIREYINKINGLYCIGRNGRHVYGNMDQVMESALCAVDVIKKDGQGKERIWRVEKKYIEDY